MYTYVDTLISSPLWHPLLVLAGALALDVTVGEPPNALHPVVWMGRLQRALRRLAPRDRAGAFVWGCVMAASGPLVFGGVAFALTRALAPWPLAQLAVEIYLFKSAFALRALATAARAVQQALAAGDVAAARRALRSLVSRDPSTLSPALVAAAAVESVAENTSDSLVAPLCFFVVAGVPAALAYRAINTLDAMIGYHGETEWLGKAAARLDDVANLLPARVTAALLVVASAVAGASPSRALRVWLRDGARTESPNAGRPMAAMAGALGVQLEKVGHYRLGDAGALPGAAEIARAVTIMNVAGALAAVAAAAIVYVVHG
jgi:adenosylcobinamide-phosphate synthase